jgi:tetratricopeptide (TPR) repeat protein
MFRASLLLGEFEKAEQYFYQWKNATDDPGVEVFMNHEIGYVYYQLGKTKEAEKIFKEQIQKQHSILDKGRNPNYILARIYAFQGDRKEALKYLAEVASYGFTNGWHDFILLDPILKSLRDDPDFKAIVKQAQEKKATLRMQVREMEERGELDL